MPYIDKDARLDLDMMIREPKTPGELNYIITCAIQLYMDSEISYSKINEVIGVLECAKLELYRRLAAPYEDNKKEQNGDVY